MAIYIYETIPTNPRQKPRRFEVEQKMSDPPLRVDPKTGLAVRRLIVGGSGIVTHGASILSMKVRRSGR
ncbi:MAG: zinc ribbon domain-containing protein [Verrucomicrobiales bacterium]|nr:zinc ribbon domain-containing protein [Verrucomicrobiales bacterium]